MATLTTDKSGAIVVSALASPRQLAPASGRGRTPVARYRKTRAARGVLLSIRDYVKLAAPEPEVLRVIGEESERKGTNTMTARQIEQVIKASRTQRSKR
jgi:hypothetical protein